MLYNFDLGIIRLVTIYPIHKSTIPPNKLTPNISTRRQSCSIKSRFGTLISCKWCYTAGHVSQNISRMNIIYDNIFFAGSESMCLTLQNAQGSKKAIIRFLVAPSQVAVGIPCFPRSTARRDRFGCSLYSQTQ